MKLKRIAKIGKLAKRMVGDIVFPYRFTFNPDSVAKAGSPQWLYSLDYCRKGMLRHYNMRRDERGVVMMSHYVDHAEGGHYYSPVKIAHYALAAWNDHIRGDATALDDFWSSINWILENQEASGDSVIWRTPTSNPRYDLPTGYVSAIVQGLILSALARSLVLKDDPRVRKTIQGAVRFFYKPVSEGGILAQSKFGLIYEEYPCLPPGHVVNGFMFSLNGLWDAARMGDKEAAERFAAAVPSLENLIPAWVTARWSYYDLRYMYLPEKANLATRHYQYLHIDQLKFFEQVRKTPVLEDTVRRLGAQMRNPLNWFSAYINKSRGLIGKSV